MTFAPRQVLDQYVDPCNLIRVFSEDSDQIAWIHILTLLRLHWTSVVHRLTLQPKLSRLHRYPGSSVFNCWNVTWLYVVIIRVLSLFLLTFSLRCYSFRNQWHNMVNYLYYVDEDCNIKKNKVFMLMFTFFSDQIWGIIWCQFSLMGQGCHLKINRSCLKKTKWLLEYARWSKSDCAPAKWRVDVECSLNSLE